MNYYRGVRGLLLIVTGVVLMDASLEMALGVISIVVGAVEAFSCVAHFMFEGDMDG